MEKKFSVLVIIMVILISFSIANAMEIIVTKEVSLTAGDVVFLCP